MVGLLFHSCTSVSTPKRGQKHYQKISTSLGLDAGSCCDIHEEEHADLKIFINRSINSAGNSKVWDLRKLKQLKRLRMGPRPVGCCTSSVCFWFSLDKMWSDTYRITYAHDTTHSHLHRTTIAFSKRYPRQANVTFRFITHMWLNVQMPPRTRR